MSLISLTLRGGPDRQILGGRGGMGWGFKKMYTHMQNSDVNFFTYSFSVSFFLRFRNSYVQ